MASTTIKEFIIDYARNKYYFHINDFKKCFTEKRIKFEEDTLKKIFTFLRKMKLYFPQAEDGILIFKKNLS